MERLTTNKLICEAKASDDVRVLKPAYNVIFDRLKEYEEQEEQGLLQRLPCKIGDTVYIITPVLHILTRNFAGIHISTVKSRMRKRIDYIIVTNEIGSERYDMRKIGKTIFFDKADAENKLKGGKI